MLLVLLASFPGHVQRVPQAPLSVVVDWLDPRPPPPPEPVQEPVAPRRVEGASGEPTDEYWDRMAGCETGHDWAMTGSTYSGGVGFYNGTWRQYGGEEYADNAGHATREQQIVVANRVWAQLGLGRDRGLATHAWGCVATIGMP